jgi:hypothetical protein
VARELGAETVAMPALATGYGRLPFVDFAASRSRRRRSCCTLDCRPAIGRRRGLIAPPACGIARCEWHTRTGVRDTRR